MSAVTAHHRFAFALTSVLFTAACTSAAPSSSAPATSAGPSGAPSATAAPGPAAGTDTIPTSAGDLKITPVYHATLVLEHGGKVVIVDPWSKGALDKLPKADLILLTDVHFDHMDKEAIAKVRKAGTVIVAPAAVQAEIKDAKVLKNGEKTTEMGIGIEAIPMYNKVRGPEAGKLFHDKGRGNGYVLTFADKRVYLSGDTECTDEMKALPSIDVAFVCMNLPYTMPPAEAAQCVKAFKPKILYPYHYRDSDLTELTKGLDGEKGVLVRLRNWYP
jgi:L-ascorbate metabolism protein UlaG (beta-lactamase superfamily)